MMSMPNCTPESGAEFVQDTKKGKYGQLEIQVEATGEFGKAIVAFAQSRNQSIWQLLKDAKINQQMFRDAAVRKFHRIQFNNMGHIIVQLQALGFEFDPKALSETVISAAPKQSAD